MATKARKVTCPRVHSRTLKKRSRGKKPRARAVVECGEGPCEKMVRPGKRRELNLPPMSNSDDRLPRKMQNLLATKTALETKSRVSAKSSDGSHVFPSHSESNKETHSKGACKRRLGASKATLGDTSNDIRPELLGKEELRQYVVRTIRKNTHQYEKKKAFYARKKAKAALRKQKRRSERTDDTDGDSDSESGRGSSYNAYCPRFGEQAQAPPKLTSLKHPVLKRS